MKGTDFFLLCKNADAPPWTRSGLSKDALTWDGWSGHSSSQCLDPCCVLMGWCSHQGMTLGLNRKLLLTPLPDLPFFLSWEESPWNYDENQKFQEDPDFYLFSLLCLKEFLVCTMNSINIYWLNEGVTENEKFAFSWVFLEFLHYSILTFHNSVLLGASISSVQSLSSVGLFATPWIAACQASLSITNSRSSLCI